MSEQSTNVDDRPIKLTVDLRVGQDSQATVRQLQTLQVSQASIAIGIDTGKPTDSHDELTITIQAFNLPPNRKEIADLMMSIGEAIAKGEVVHESHPDDGSNDG